MSTPPKIGDLRVCHVPLIVDHAISIDAPDMHTAKSVYDALNATLTVLLEHHIVSDAGETFVQRFDEDGWSDVDPADYDDEQRHFILTAQEQLDQLRMLLDKPFPPGEFYVRGMPSTYHALAELYDQDLAVDLARILRPELVDELK